MPDIRDVTGSEQDADVAQARLDDYCESLQAYDVEPIPGLVLGLAAIAVCERLRANSVRTAFYMERADGRF